MSKLVYATARIVRARPGASYSFGFLVLDGAYTDTVFASERRSGLKLGDEVTVKFHPDDQFATIVEQAVHGYPITARGWVDTNRDGKRGQIILVDRSVDYPEEPFVTALWFDGDGEWSNGHYFTSRDDAREDFYARVKRGF
jgi:hypothetical protein